jgi:hypothetical protein
MNKSNAARLEQTKSPRRVSRQEYDFALVLGNLRDLDDDRMDKLFAAGCDDATFSFRYGVVYAEFSREADSYQGAVLSAIDDVLRASVGAEVQRVNECDLVSAADIARRIDRSRQSISQYIKGERGPGNFPPPECFLNDDQPLWAWCAVSFWLVENQMVRREVWEEARFTDVVNDLLAIERQERENPQLISEVKRSLKVTARSGSAKAS